MNDSLRTYEVTLAHDASATLRSPRRAAIETLAEQGSTEGEREAARAALERLTPEVLPTGEQTVYVQAGNVEEATTLVESMYPTSTLLEWPWPVEP